MTIHTYMRWPLRLAALLIVLVALAGCGPKNVGEDTLKADEGYTSPGREPEAQLRYPISGSRIEQRLFYLNQPHIMAERQQKQREYYNQRLGIQSTGTPDDLFPRRYSPFR